MPPREPFYTKELTDHSYLVLTQLRALLPEMVLIGGWGTWVRARGLPSHDIDVLVDHSGLQAMRAVAEEATPSTHLGGLKWRAQVEGIHVDLYLPYQSRLGRVLQLRVEALSAYVEVIDSWRVLDVGAHAATKLAALLDRPESLPGEKDRQELMALLAELSPSAFVERLLESSSCDPGSLAGLVARGVDYLRDLTGLRREDRARIDTFDAQAAGIFSACGLAPDDREVPDSSLNREIPTWRRGPSGRDGPGGLGR